MYDGGLECDDMTVGMFAVSAHHASKVQIVNAPHMVMSYALRVIPSP